MKKNICMALIFLIVGLIMLIVSCTMIIPSAKLASKNCTLKMDAVVTDCEEYDDLDSDGYLHTYYRVRAKYVVNNTTYEMTIRESAIEPAVIGSTISIWVDPENPSIMTTTLEWEKVAILSIGFSLFFVMIGVIFTVVVIKNYKRKLVS